MGGPFVGSINTIDFHIHREMNEMPIVEELSPLSPALWEQSCETLGAPEGRKGWGGREGEQRWDGEGCLQFSPLLLPASGKAISQLIRLMVKCEEMGFESMIVPGYCLISKFLPEGDQKREKMVGTEWMKWKRAPLCTHTNPAAHLYPHAWQMTKQTLRHHPCASRKEFTLPGLQIYCSRQSCPSGSCGAMGVAGSDRMLWPQSRDKWHSPVSPSSNPSSPPWRRAQSLETGVVSSSAGL